MVYTIIFCLIAIVIGFVVGHLVASKSMAKKLMTKYYAGDLVINMEDIEQDTISIDFVKNPKELMAYNYVLIGVKIRQ